MEQLLGKKVVVSRGRPGEGVVVGVSGSQLTVDGHYTDDIGGSMYRTFVGAEGITVTI